MKLSDYIQGLRKGKEAHRLEKESMKDAFLANAMDGFQQVEGNHEWQIEQLRKKISARSSRRRRRRRNMYAIIGSVAACLVIGLGVSTYFIYLKNENLQDESLVLVKDSVSKTTLSQDEELAQAEISQDTIRVIIPHNTEKKKVIAKVQQTAKIDEVLMEEASAASPAALSESKQINNKVIAGKVINEKGEPIIGASVYFKGTDVGAITDLNGEFTINKTKDHNELTANFIGYEAVEIPVDTCKNLLIAMNESKQTLEEVVVTGYGTQKKTSMTGSVASVSRNVKKERLHAPEPVIGRRKYREYLEENLIRPTDNECKDIKGKVTLSFFVGKDGKPQRIVVLKGLCKTADKEAIRLVKEGPKWTSGILPAEINVKF